MTPRTTSISHSKAPLTEATHDDRDVTPIGVVAAAVNVTEAGAAGTRRRDSRRPDPS